MIRRKAAQGGLPVSLQERIEILVFLSADKDEEIRNTAFYTLQTLNPQEVQQVLADAATPVAVLDFAANHLAVGRKEWAEALGQNPSLPADVRDFVKQLATLPAEETTGQLSQAPAPVEVAAARKEGGDEKKETMIQRIGRMTVAEKIKAALTGSQDERNVLIRDSNKIVARAVLQSPKLSDQEIERIAAMKNVTEEILRLVAMNRKFVKTYAVVRQLINNPRTPIDVGLPLLGRLNERDMKGLELNKNIAEVIRTMARKLVKQKEEASKPKLPGKH